MTDRAPQDPKHPHEVPPGGTGTGPAGGGVVAPTPPAAPDPKAAADALAEFEREQKQLEEQDLPAKPAAPEVADAASEPKAAASEPKVEASEPKAAAEARRPKPDAPAAAAASASARMAALGEPTEAPPVVV